MFLRNLLLFASFVYFVSSQQLGKVKINQFPPLPIIENGKTIQTSVVLDANWRWVHNVNGYDNCYNNDWNKQYCPDPITCSKNCAIEGVSIDDYKNIYGITSSGNSVTLRYVTGSNVGSRVYLLDESNLKYKSFNLINRELVYDIDVSLIPCGLNGALYFTEMPLDGGLNSLNKAGAAFGTGYGDAQCPNDIKYINGFVNINNTGACSIEMDIWEANSQATAFTPHSCMLRNNQQLKGVYPCTDEISCGRNSARYQGVCDKDGADFNPYRLGDTSLYGFGSQFKVDTSKPFTVVTQFLTADNTDNTDIVAMKRVYIQNGKRIDGGILTADSIRQNKAKFKETNHFEQLGGFKTMTESFKRGMVFVISLWDDSSVNMLWLDSIYPTTSLEPGAKRGPCDPNRGDIWWLRRTYPNSQYTLSNIKVQMITNPPTPSTPTPPTPTPCDFKLQCSSCKLVPI